MAADLRAQALIYVLDCDHGVKIGISTQAIIARVGDLERGSGLRDIRVLRTWPIASRSHAWQVEHAAQWLLRDTRTVGEWFHCHPIEACDTVDRLLRHGIPLAFLERSA